MTNAFSTASFRAELALIAVNEREASRKNVWSKASPLEYICRDNRLGQEQSELSGWGEGRGCNLGRTCSASG